jgi:hypothetical protein
VTFALLAVLGAIREYGRALLKPLGAPVGTIECYILRSSCHRAGAPTSRSAVRPHTPASARRAGPPHVGARCLIP